ncbi:MAG: hypothetical protein LBE38_02155 [Deltaproteobacteria bacterium]|jgi:hypothetical protein|nr:hypothetical protein [Deltaproteobacteria bacterium]
MFQLRPYVAEDTSKEFTHSHKDDFSYVSAQYLAMLPEEVDTNCKIELIVCD